MVWQKNGSGIFLFNVYVQSKSNISISMLKHLAATMDHGAHFKYYLQGDILSLDNTNYLLLSDVLEVSAGWSVISTHTWLLQFSNSQLHFH